MKISTLLRGFSIFAAAVKTVESQAFSICNNINGGNAYNQTMVTSANFQTIVAANQCQNLSFIDNCFSGVKGLDFCNIAISNGINGPISLGEIYYDPQANFASCTTVQGMIPGFCLLTNNGTPGKNLMFNATNNSPDCNYPEGFDICTPENLEKNYKTQDDEREPENETPLKLRM